MNEKKPNIFCLGSCRHVYPQSPLRSTSQTVGLLKKVDYQN